MPWSDDALVELLHETALEIRAALDELDDWGPAGTAPGQYLSDLAADAAGVRVLDEAGVGVLSEESGLRGADRDIVVVLDPLDGSTNASRGIPWFATSLCAVDADGPRAALVVDLPHGRTFTAVRGAGALRGRRCHWRRRGAPIPARPSSGSRACPPARLGGASSGLWAPPPSTSARWPRASSTASSTAAPPPTGCGTTWAGSLVCAEAGAVVADALGRDLVVLDHGARRTPVGAATPALLDALLAARPLLEGERVAGP